MRTRMLGVMWLALLVVVLSWVGDAVAQSTGEKTIRDNSGAGMWYPANPTDLRQTIDLYLSRASSTPPEGKIITGIVPHAGYGYSGQVAAYTYRLIQNMPFKRVVLLGFSHRVPFRGFSVSQYSGYKTPLGVALIDQDFSRALLSVSPRKEWVPQAEAQEHSLENQIPFLQTVLKDFKMVLVFMGEQDFQTCSLLASELTRLLANTTDTLILASTDLSHFHADQQARTLDGDFIRHVREFAPEALAKAVASGSCEACGAGPAIAGMLAARALGANRSLILNYANSGDVTGDRRQVVGYLSAALIKTP
jgi:AmmeMemoRadiSam system protein B